MNGEPPDDPFVVDHPLLDAVTRGQLTNGALRDALADGLPTFHAAMSALTWQQMAEALAATHLGEHLEHWLQRHSDDDAETDT